MSQSDPFLTTSEVAETVRVSVSTVARWAREGLIAHVKLPGGDLRFRQSDVDRMLSVDHAEPSSSEPAVAS